MKRVSVTDGRNSYELSVSFPSASTWGTRVEVLDFHGAMTEFWTKNVTVSEEEKNQTTTTTAAITERAQT